MKYKSESLFTKYQISPTKNINELRVLFQTDPIKRRDLPIVIKTISNPAALLEEELFTPHDVTDTNSFLSAHSRLINNLASVMKEINEKNVQNSLAEINLIAKSKDKWSDFYYYNVVGKAKADPIIQDFLSMAMDEMEKQFFSTIGEIPWNLSKQFLKYLNGSIPFITWDANRKNNFEDKLIEYASKLSSLEGKSEQLEKRLSIVLSIATMLKSKEMIEMLKFVVKKIGDDYDNNGIALLKSYPKIAPLYEPQELLDMSEFINRMMNKYLDFHAATSFKGSEILLVAKLLSVAYDALQKKLSSATDTINYDQNFDEDDIEFGKILADFMASTSASWINEYKSKLNIVKEDDSASNIYDLIEHIMSAKPSSSKLKRFIGNVVLKFTSFESDIAWAFDAHEKVNKNSNAAPANPNDIDSIIAKYYWTIFMIDDINENLFNNIRGIGFDVLARVNGLAKMLNPYSSNYERTLVRDAIIKVLNTLPRDWFFDDDKRVEKAIRDFGGTPTGSISISSIYIDKYEYLFKGTKSSKHGRYKYEHPYSSFKTISSSSSSNYSSSSSSSSSSNYSSSRSSSSNSGCYIATCIYGSYDCPQVWTLRRYRDYYLDEHWWGRLFIKIYYAISPTLVKWFGNTKWFKKLFRNFLEKKLTKLKEKKYEDTPYNDKY